MNFETAKKVIDSSLRKGLNKYSTLDTDRIISSVMVKVAPGYDAEAVAAQIRQQVPGVSVATSAHRRLISRIIIREALAVNALGGVGGIIISGVLLVSFSGLVRQSLGGGFLVPSLPTLALLALAALASVGLVALVSSWIALRYVTTMDASLALKEGE